MTEDVSGAPASPSPSPTAMPQAPQPQPAPGRGPFVPLLMLALAVVGWTGFQCLQLWNEREQLATLHQNQQAQVDAAGRLRASLDATAADTARLAAAGNANARLLVDELRRRGITINPNPGTAPQLPAPAKN